jgi:hypothetical protein
MFAMKRVHLFAVAIVALAALVIGCGGSGNGNPNTTGDVPTGTPRVEAVVAVEPTNLKDPSKYTELQLENPLNVNPNDLIDRTLYGIQDPRDIQTNEKYYFQLVTYDDSGNRHIIENSQVRWETSNAQGTFGQIGTNSGLFTASNRVTQKTQFIFATYAGHRYEAPYEIKTRQVRLIGKVVEEISGKPIGGIELFFFDSTNTLVGSVESAFDGSFRASVPLNTTKFSVTVESVPSNFYQSFMFETLRYTVGVPACKAPLPTFTVVGPYELGSPVKLTVRTEAPNPDPTGCSN